ncbi:MAG: TetR/AcrR family transcriptional regulator [Gemmatimonadota bacterium]
MRLPAIRQALGIQALLEAAHTPRGSFYHHFVDKEDFALQVVDRYMGQVDSTLDRCSSDEGPECRRRITPTPMPPRDRSGRPGPPVAGRGGGPPPLPAPR